MEEKDLGQFKLVRNNKKIYVKDNQIIKVFDHNYYTFSDVLKEAMNQEYARELGFNVPELYSVFTVGEDFAIASRKIEGKTFAELVKENPEDKKKYIQKLVRIQHMILSQRSSNLKLPKLKDKMNSYISESGLDAVTRYELSVRLEKMPNHYKICHGDLCLDNLILEGDKVYILDWAHAARGNATGDAAMSYLLFLLDGDLDGAKIYIKEFCKEFNIASSYVNEWISVVSASKIKTCKDEKKKELLLRNINVVEY